MTIDEFYRSVLDMAKKASGTYIKPEHFNRAIGIAQEQLYMERLGNIQEYQLGYPAPRIGYPMSEKVENDLRPFLTTVNAVVIDAGGQYTLPTNYVHSVAVYITTTGQAVDMVNPTALPQRLSSTLLPINVEYPICVLLPTVIQFYPITGLDGLVSLRYLRKPTKPIWAYTVSSGRPVYDVGNSVQIEFADINHNDLLVRTLAQLSVHIEDVPLRDYSMINKKEGM